MRVKYKKNIQIVLLDFAAIIFSFLAASKICYASITNEWYTNLFGIGFIILILIYLCIFSMVDIQSYIGKRGALEELKVVVKINCYMTIMLIVLIFLLHDSILYSKTFFGTFIIINICSMYLSHLYYKQFIERYYQSKLHKKNLMVITTKENAKTVLRKLNERLDLDREISSLTIIDEDMIGQRIGEIGVKANCDTMYEFIRTEVVDEVFINIPNHDQEDLEKMILEFESMGVTVNLSINSFGLNIKEKKVQNFGHYNVLTFGTKMFEPTSLILKRILDIVGALVGIALTLFVSLFIAPAILIESRGPLIFSQVRIGKNGRRFKIYKFRSMSQDAEERKKDLMLDNEMDGYMFKISNDPRITKVGKFIRKTSIDELPQFFNVLRGDMSLVGTRPPTEDEFLLYDLRHKRRLSLKPGMTGLWQVNGRSDIDNFEDVVKLDLEYIDHWTILIDIKLLFKTVWVVLKKKGSK